MRLKWEVKWWNRRPFVHTPAQSLARAHCGLIWIQRHIHRHTTHTIFLSFSSMYIYSLIEMKRNPHKARKEKLRIEASHKSNCRIIQTKFRFILCNCSGSIWITPGYKVYVNEKCKVEAKKNIHTWEFERGGGKDRQTDRKSEKKGAKWSEATWN